MSCLSWVVHNNLLKYFKCVFVVFPRLKPWWTNCRRPCPLREGLKIWGKPWKSETLHISLHIIRKLKCGKICYIHYSSTLSAYSCNPPCVPYLGMYLTDLAFIEEGTPNFTEEGLVNFSKMRMVGTCMRKKYTHGNANHLYMYIVLYISTYILTFL